MSFVIAAFAGGELIGESRSNSLFADAQARAQELVESRSADRVEIRDASARVLFHFPPPSAAGLDG